MEDVVTDVPDDFVSCEKELKVRRGPKRPISTYYTLTSNSLSHSGGGGGIQRSKTLGDHCNTSESGSSSPKNHFYQKNGEMVTYFSDEQLIGAVENAATTLTSALQLHSQQVANAPTTQQQLKKELEAMTQDELCHQRRFMAQEALIHQRAMPMTNELWQGQHKLAKSLKVKKLVSTRLNNLVNEALCKSELLLNLKAFVLFKEDGAYQPYNRVGGEAYETIQNDYPHRIITLDELMMDLNKVKKSSQEEVFKEILHTCFFLEDVARPLHYTIYTQEIEFIGENPIDSRTSLLARLFLPRRSGQYYAIIVNFALSKRSLLVKPPVSQRRSFLEDRTGLASAENTI
jgi:hypothetical protein